MYVALGMAAVTDGHLSLGVWNLVWKLIFSVEVLLLEIVFGSEQLQVWWCCENPFEVMSRFNITTTNMYLNQMKQVMWCH
jgi:hypothetical protein